jgi:hypothetical protein
LEPLIPAIRVVNLRKDLRIMNKKMNCKRKRKKMMIEIKSIAYQLNCLILIVSSGIGSRKLDL